MVPINSNLLWMIAGTLAALSVGSAIRLAALRSAAAEVVKKRLGSLKVWWILAVLWSAAALLGQIGAAVLLAIASFLGLREYLRLLGTRKQIGNATIIGLMLLGICHYALIVVGLSEIAKWFLPIAALLLLGAIRAALGVCEGYVRITGGLYWGSMLMIYGLSHSLFLFEIETATEPVVGPAGWFLYLILLTEMNDIMQALVGRKFGKHKITPQVSPHKTLEGLVGGLVCTAVLAILLAPILTTLMESRQFWQGILLSVSAGILISIFGFLGDLNMSAIKRDAGVKDGSTLLPGMGGVIDRIDSLTFTGPAFYYWLLLLTNT